MLETREWQCRLAWNTRLMCIFLLVASVAASDTVKLKDGTVLYGAVDKDGSLVQVFDDEGLRRVVLRDSRIESISADVPMRPERFRLIQRMDIHAGEMPAYAIDIESSPWDKLGRRQFKYVGPRGKKVEMSQAIIELGPVGVRYRGIDGFWVGSLDTKTIPKSVILGLLARVQQENKDERVRVAQFMIQAQWFEEAKNELDRLQRDFPELAENVAAARTLLIDAEARYLLDEVVIRSKASQPRDVEARLKSFPSDRVSPVILTDVRNQLRIIQARAVENRDLAKTIQKAADDVSEDRRKSFEPRLLEILKMLEEAPDVARARLEAFQTPDDSLSPEQRLALIESAWVAGSEHATSDESTAESYWVARELVRSYLRTGADQQLARDEILGRLKKLGQSGGLKNEKPAIDLAVLTEISRQMPPPLHDQRASAPGTIRTIRVFDDPNPGEPSEYAAWLPPEYHSSRSYPAIVVLHGKESPSEALGPWLEEATRRGFILIAPEYGMRGKPAAYQYSSGEHAAVLLALHDARRRFAIDSNRVFLAGTLEGGNMAWDVALAHPDLFAGAAVISGFPAKFAWPNKANAGFVPLYLVMGDLSAPTEDPVVFEQWAKPLIKGNNDIRYVKMYKRGLEPFPEEIPTILQWASSRSRVPAPNKWEAVSCREGDDRFYGIVIKGFAPNRATSPISADPLGRNINPAEMKLRSNNVLNKLVVDTNGITALDIWVSPSLIDFTKRVEVQHNGKSVFKAQPDLAEFRPFLDDLRIRGDRQQTYWLKVPLNASPGRGGRGG